MTELIRPSLKQVINHLTDAHAGLLMQRGLPCWEEGEKQEKQQLVKK